VELHPRLRRHAPYVYSLAAHELRPEQTVVVGHMPLFKRIELA
jgi:hypothetical protein